MSDSDHELHEEEIAPHHAERQIHSEKNAWKPPDNWDPMELACCRANHISSRPASGIAQYPLRGYKSKRSVESLIPLPLRADDEFMALWEGCGFRPFLDTLSAVDQRNASLLLITGFLECWWDTTNTFHFPWGEMTITPRDFAMLSGLSFTTRPVEMDHSLSVGHPTVRRLLGTLTVESPVKDTWTSIPYAALVENLKDEGHTREQKVRILLLLLIEGYMCPHKGTSARVHLKYLASLHDLDAVHTYDWGGLAYACLFDQMRTAVRQLNCRVNIGIAGLWRLIEVSP